MFGIHARWVFLIATPVCGADYWWFADWWAYGQFSEKPIPKFLMPWWWQITESSIVGAAAGGLVAGVWWMLSRRMISCC